MWHPFPARWISMHQRHLPLQIAAMGIEPDVIPLMCAPVSQTACFLPYATATGGNERNRTFDLCLIRALLYLLSYITMAGEEERLTSFISTRKRAYRTPHICVSVLSFPRITGFGMCVGRRLPWWQLRLPRYCQSPGVLL